MSNQYTGDKNQSPKDKITPGTKPLGVMKNDPNTQEYGKDNKGTKGQTNPPYGTQAQTGKYLVCKLHYPYLFSSASITAGSRKVFHKYDKNADHLLSLPECRLALSEFCKLNSSPEPTTEDFQCLFSMFDLDKSGVLDCGEFKMMLEMMGATMQYTSLILSESRKTREARIQECKKTAF